MNLCRQWELFGAVLSLDVECCHQPNASFSLLPRLPMRASTPDAVTTTWLVGLENSERPAAETRTFTPTAAFWGQTKVQNRSRSGVEGGNWERGGGNGPWSHTTLQAADVVVVDSSFLPSSYYIFASIVWPSAVGQDPSVAYASVGFPRRR
jgi:hypothetical protein